MARSGSWTQRLIVLACLTAVVMVGAVVWAAPSDATPTLNSVDMAVLQTDYELSLGDPSEPSAISQADAESTAQTEYPEAGRVLEAVYAHCNASDVDEHCWALSLDPNDTWELPLSQPPDSPIPPTTATSMVVLVSSTTGEVLTTMIW